MLPISGIVRHGSPALRYPLVSIPLLCLLVLFPSVLSMPMDGGARFAYPYARTPDVTTNISDQVSRSWNTLFGEHHHFPHYLLDVSDEWNASVEASTILALPALRGSVGLAGMSWLPRHYTSL